MPSKESGWTTAAKVFGVFAVLIPFIVAGVAAHSDLKGETKEIKTEVQNVEKHLNENDKQDDQQDAKIEQSRTVQAEMNQKLERAITILERIDAKTGRP